MELVKISTLEVVDRQRVEANYPNTSFPMSLTNEILRPLGYLVLEEDEFPELEDNQYIVQGEIRVEEDEQGSRAVRGWEVKTTEPHVVPEPVVQRFITRLAFLSRFTDEEAITIDLLSIGATAEAATIRRYLSKINAATYIDLDREDVRQGVQSLEASGVLTEGRSAVILDASIEEIEKPLTMV